MFWISGHLCVNAIQCSDHLEMLHMEYAYGTIPYAGLLIKWVELRTLWE